MVLLDEELPPALAQSRGVPPAAAVGGVQCFMLEPTPIARHEVRRFCWGRSERHPEDWRVCPLGGIHDSSRVVSFTDAIFRRSLWNPSTSAYEDTGEQVRAQVPDDFEDQHSGWANATATANPLLQLPHDSPQWPTRCHCGYEFKDIDEWQVNARLLYAEEDTSRLWPLREAPAGAVWYAPWVPWRHQVGTAPLVIKLPDLSYWMPDSRASNCTMRESDPDYTRHYCWVLHGTPPRLTADKNGPTCAAGAGSIATGQWHGFLRDGVLA